MNTDDDFYSSIYTSVSYGSMYGSYSKMEANTETKSHTWNAFGKPDSIMENSGGFKLNRANNTDCAD